MQRQRDGGGGRHNEEGEGVWFGKALYRKVGPVPEKGGEVTRRSGEAHTRTHRQEGRWEERGKEGKTEKLFFFLLSPDSTQNTPVCRGR